MPQTAPVGAEGQWRSHLRTRLFRMKARPARQVPNVIATFLHGLKERRVNDARRFDFALTGYHGR
jgi:hypothetical protein